MNEYRFHPAYEDGQVAYGEGMPRDRNPYATVRRHTQNAERSYHAWNAGWDAAAQQEIDWEQEQERQYENHDEEE